MEHSWLTWAVLSAAFAAATAILSKVGLNGVDPDAAQVVRTAMVVIVLAIAIAGAQKAHRLLEINGRGWVFLSLAGLTTAASWACYFRALQHGDAARVAAVDKLSVIMVAIFAAIALRERLALTGWLGIVLTTAGVCLLSWKR